MALLAALPEGERALWACAFYAGLRRGELRALRWGDVDLPARVIHVQRGWDAVEGEQAAKSAAGNRRVPILELLARELAAHKLRTKARQRRARVRQHCRPTFHPGDRPAERSRRGAGEVPNKEADGPRTILAKKRDDAQQPISCMRRGTPARPS